MIKDHVFKYYIGPEQKLLGIPSFWRPAKIGTFR